MKYVLTLLALSFSLIAFANEGESAASTANTDGTEACARPAVVDGTGSESSGGAATSNGQPASVQAQ
jgi:hypothetical protein